MIQRNFIPGSEWLYFKLYTGHKSADRLLTEVIRPLVSDLLSDGSVGDFFFIRYSDPKPHVRLRLRIPTPEHYGRVFQAVSAAFGSCIENGLLTDVVCDTYRRELERYGTRTMELSESLFGIDSRAMLDLLPLLSEAADPEHSRWLLSLNLLDDLLGAFGCDIEAKSALLESVSRGFRREFGCDKQPYSKQLDNKYRDKRVWIDATLGNSPEMAAPYTKALTARREEMMLIADQIRSMGHDERIEVPLDSLLGSYMHMTMNRLFRSKNRQFELVIYHFMDKYYRSALAREKYMK